jgi:hypothetical protein
MDEVDGVLHSYHRKKRKYYMDKTNLNITPQYKYRLAVYIILRPCIFSQEIATLASYC